ncbi:MAG: 16S rRNA (adenine(1518)-N(6)/adenine(1519)-N(6))-dimethyltransferase RsmA [Thermomicrobiales bacterium]
MGDGTTESRQARPRTRADWERVLRQRGIRPARSMGQNFLVSPDVVAAIVETAGVQPGDAVVEIGPGMGILTGQLLDAGARVTGVELDDQLAELLRSEWKQNPSFRLVERDARYVDVEAITAGQPYVVVANLPYSVATVVIRHFVEAANPPTSLTVMVQREVAERMTASSGEMSLLGLATQYYADAEIAFIVPPDVFLPPPKVESAVVSMRVRESTPLTADGRDHMFALATMAFQRKRKTIANGLAQGLDRPRAEVPTDEPDPDSQTFERAAAAPPMPSELDVQKARVWQLAKVRWGSLGEAAAAAALKDYAAGHGIDLGDPVQLRQLADQWAQDATPRPVQGRKASDAQITKLHTVFSELGITDRGAKLARVGAILGREVDTTKTLTAREAAQVIDRLENAEGGEQHG